MPKIALYFGTFNPIHIGHMAIANYMLEFSDVERLWFIISPQSPFKQNQNLLDNYQRLEMVHRAIGDNPKYRAVDIEFKLPIPSYTVDTLAHLAEQYPEHEFYLIMGEDNLQHLNKWKNYEVILEHHHILAYPRPGSHTPEEFQNHPHIHCVEAPLMELSSSFIRNAIAEGKDVQHFLPHGAWEYLEEMGFYRR
ncbi:MAG: nicotinate (nicotinamide) nucleotide adenylyltransferase [Mangrovibacterium sp.]